MRPPSILQIFVIVASLVHLQESSRLLGRALAQVRPATAGERPDSSQPKSIDPAPNRSIFEAVPQGLLRGPDVPGQAFPADATQVNQLYVPELLKEFQGVIRDGETVNVAVFDAGKIFVDHPEFGPGARVTNDAGLDSVHPHATWVASVIAAAGTDDPRCRGVARKANLKGFHGIPSVDLTRLEAVADQFQISNHSYTDPAGWDQDHHRATCAASNCQWYWHGRPGNTEDARFGEYSKRNSQLDRILAKHPMLSSFVAAGNKRGEERPALGEPHRVVKSIDPVSGQVTWGDSSDLREFDDFEKGGVDTIVGLGLSKNAICVGAVMQQQSADDPFRITSFTSWGPADDHRIKPDLVALGNLIRVASPPGGLKDYEDKSGTSFATPAAAGVGALLAELFKAKRGRWPFSDELKAAMIHTAVDLGEPGPDVKFGWGLIHAHQAGKLIAATDRIFRRDSLRRGETRSYRFVRPNGSKRLRVTLAWIDPAAPPNESVVDDFQRTLQNDLDASLVSPGGSPSPGPWALKPFQPLAPAIQDRGNDVDNVEVIDVSKDVLNRLDPGGDGVWTVHIGADADRFRGDSAQAFTLIVDGIESPGSGVSPPLQTNLAEIAQPARGRWQFLGPENLGGPTRALVIHPKNPKTLWAGSLSGGVWKSEDGGEHWRLVTGPLSALPVSCLAIDPIHPDTLYAGTGVTAVYGNFSGMYSVPGRVGAAGIPGAGLLRSTDGGNSWHQLAATRDSTVNQIAVCPAGGTLVMATTTGIYRSRDDGATFLKVHDHRAALSQIVDLAFAPGEPDRCLAISAGSTIFRSTDRGENWTAGPRLDDGEAAPASISRVTFHVAKPKIAYAWVATSMRSTQVGGTLHRSDDGGVTFFQVDRIFEDAGDIRHGYIPGVLWAGDPEHDDLVLCGGHKLVGRRIGTPNVRYEGGEAYAIASMPGFGKEGAEQLYVAHSQGISRLDGSDLRIKAEFKEPNTSRSIFLHPDAILNHGYSATPFFGIAADEPSGLILGGTFGRGTMAANLSREPDVMRNWLSVDTNRRIDTNEPRLPPIGGRGAILPGTIPVCIGHSETEGPWVCDSNRWPSRKAATLLGLRPTLWPRNNFLADFPTVNPLVREPGKDGALILGGEGLWRLRVQADIEATLVPVSAPTDLEFVQTLAIYASGDASEVIWLATDDGKLYRALNGRALMPSWVRVDDAEGLPPPPWHCTAILCHPSRPGTAWIALGDYRSDNLYVTKDAGATFRRTGKGLPPVPVRSLTRHPDRPEEVYAGNDFGVFMSRDSGETWQPENIGPENVRVNELSWMGRHLLAATSRGVYRLNLSRAVGN